MLSPEGGKSGGVVETKQALFPVLPVHHVVVRRLFQDSKCELPELSGGRDICIRREKMHNSHTMNSHIIIV